MECTSLSNNRLERGEDKLSEDEELIQRLQERARTIRKHIIRMTGIAQSGHPGGSLSAADIVTVLYFHEMTIDPRNPKWEDRDRFVLSKGHASPVLYAALAEKGYFDVAELDTFRAINSRLSGHPSMKDTPGVDMSTGSLGQGLSTAVGMALAAKILRKDFRVYAMIGDGESQEGQIWEAAMAAPKFGLDNLTVFLDHNGLQIDGPNDEVMPIKPVKEKWEAFNWHVLEIDGHNLREIIKALGIAREVKGRPTMIIANTVKGKGVSFMENVVDFHGNPPTPEQMEQALAELEEAVMG